MIDPRWLIGHGLILRGSSVQVGAYTAGTISRPSYGESDWKWSFDAPSHIPPGLVYSGKAESKQEAKKAFRAAYDEWMTRVMKREGPTLWKGADSEWGPPRPRR